MERQEPHIAIKSNGTDQIIWPICVCSGKVLQSNSKITFCPNSGIPALFSEYVDYLEPDGTGVDPIFGNRITSSELKQVCCQNHLP